MNNLHLRLAGRKPKARNPMLNNTRRWTCPLLIAATLLVVPDLVWADKDQGEDKDDALVERLPDAVYDRLIKRFPDANILRAERDKDDDDDYEVYLKHDGKTYEVDVDEDEIDDIEVEDDKIKDVYDDSQHE